MQALAEAFGTTVSQSNATSVTTSDGRTTTDFSSLSLSEVKGEWIETIGQPQFDDIRVEQNMLTVRVIIRGRARAVESAGVELDARLLRNGTAERDESDAFRNGDDLYLRFQSPVDGHLSVYLYSEAEQAVYCLLPYRVSADGTFRVKHDTTYIFFNAKTAERPVDTDEYVMTCEGGCAERNYVYVLFSPNEYFKSNSVSLTDARPRQLSFDAFQRWLGKCKTKDCQFVSLVKPLTVAP